MIRTADLLDLASFEHAALFDGCEFPWQALPRIKEYVRAHLQPANHARILGTPFVGPDVFIGEGTVIEHGAVLKGPAIIGRNCEIRAGAYIRDNVLVGDGCVLGNSCEFKNAVLLNGAQVPHFSYVGDSILGCKAHLGAGVICSNLVRQIQRHRRLGRPQDGHRPAEIRRDCRRRRGYRLQQRPQSRLDHRP